MAADESHDDRTQSFIALTSGTSVSHYKIIKKIGSGGMGEVYLAEDTKLERKVALKFLSPYLCQDEKCQARFKREAQAAAKLGHANIVAVYEVGEYKGRPWFSMENVEGASLDKHIQQGKLNQAKIVGYMIGIGNGLRKAHDLGIIHRDIKPSNIIIDRDGCPRVLDFGLALARDSKKLTQSGSILGTMGYMSPEQVEGVEIDMRSDLFSLGIILYEMITGKNPFWRDSQTATMKAILSENPEPLARYRSGILDDLQRIVSKLLEKNQNHRYQTTSDLLADLKRVQDTLSRPSGESVLSADSVKKRRLSLLIAIPALVAIAAVIIIYVIAEQRPTRHLVPQWKQLTFFGDANMPAISPDGHYLAFTRPGSAGGSRMVMVQDLAGGSPIKVYEDKGAFGLRWSPDGNELLFTAWNDSMSGMVLVPRMGGSIRRYPIFGAWPSWSPDGSTFAITSTRLYFVDKKSGDTSSIACDSSLFTTDWSPNGELLVLSILTDSLSYLATCDIHGKSITPITDSIQAIYPIWSRTGDAVYFLEDRGEIPPNLYKIKVDPHTGERKGEPILLISSLQGGQYVYSISADDRKLVFRQRSISSNLWLAQLNDNGNLDVKQLTSGTSEVYDPTISPDGKRVAFARKLQDEVHIFTMPVGGGMQEQITHTNIGNRTPAWSPDGEQIAYVIRRGELERIALIDAKGGVPQILEHSTFANYLAWAPGARIICDHWPNFRLFDPASGQVDTLMTDIINGYAHSPCYSPDGHKVAMVATEYEGEWHIRGGTRRELAIYSVEDHLRICAFPTDSETGLIGWLQDGLWLYVASPDSMETTISRKRIKDGHTEEYVNLPWTDVYEIAMAPDCSSFVCVRGRSQSDIWLIENFDPNAK